MTTDDAGRPRPEDYSREEMPRYYRDLDAWWAEQSGLELVSRVGEPIGDIEGLVQFCSECSAGGSLLGEPVRGLDSHRECASDGNTVWWARPIEQPATETAVGPKPTFGLKPPFLPRHFAEAFVGENIIERLESPDALRPAGLPLGLTVDEVVLNELYVLTHANGQGPLVVKLVEILSIERDAEKVTFCEPGGRAEEWSLSGTGLVPYHGGWNPTNRLVAPSTWLEQNPDPAILTEKAAALHRLLTAKL